MPSVVIVATHPLQPTGYARVGCGLANTLQALGWDVTYYAFQNLAPVSKRYINPKIRVNDVALHTDHPESFGIQEFPKFLEEMKPDVVLIYNDILVINDFLQCIPETQKIVTYVDLVHDGENARLLQNISNRSHNIMVFSEHWTRHFPPEKTVVVPHGVDTTYFKVLDQRTCRCALGLPEHGFLVLNTNRNSYRKALDVTIRVFLEVFIAKKCPEDMYLFLNCNTNCPSGYDIPSLIDYECTRLGLDYQKISSTKILGMSNSGFLSDAVLNMLYNASDVMINTCVGEGFGLPHLEGKVLGIPQIVNATGGLKDLFDDAIPPVESLHVCRGFVAHGGVMDIPNSKAFCQRLRELYEQWKQNPNVRVQKPTNGGFSWETIGANVSEVLHSTLGKSTTFSSPCPPKES